MQRSGTDIDPVPSQLFELAAVTICLPKELSKPQENREFAAAQFAGRLVAPKYNRNRRWDMWLVEQVLLKEADPANSARTTYHFSWDNNTVAVAGRKIMPPCEAAQDEYDVIPTQDKSFGLLWLNAVHQMAAVSKADCTQLIQSVKQQFRQLAR